MLGLHRAISSCRARPQAYHRGTVPSSRRRALPSAGVSHLTVCSIAGGVDTAQNRATSVAVTFKIALQAAFGEHVRLVGSHKTLGDWEVASGCQLTWTEGHVWTATLELPKDAEFEYKFVLMPQSGPPVWETTTNRRLTTSAVGGPLALWAQWNDPDVHLESKAVTVQGAEALELLEVLTEPNTSPAFSQQWPQATRARNGAMGQPAGSSGEQHQQQLASEDWGWRQGGAIASAWGAITSALSQRGQPNATAMEASSERAAKIGFRWAESAAQSDGEQEPTSLTSPEWRLAQLQQLESLKAEMAAVKERMQEIDTMVEQAAARRAAAGEGRNA